MPRPLSVVVRLIAIATCVVTLSSPLRGLAAPQLADLGGVAELKALFNRDAGAYRMIVLLSPT